MLHPALENEEQTHTVSLIAAIADYAGAFAVRGESAIETARACLIDALARAIESLRDPECAALIGPIVPGALMPGGARVPGTSLELEPAQAAFCIGLLLCRPGGDDCWPAAGDPRPIDSLGAILAVADYQARKATMEGKPPPTVRDVLAAMVKALEIQGMLAAVDEADDAPGSAPLRIARVAATAIVAAQLGGTEGQIARAVSYACLDGEMFVHPDDRHAAGRRDWAAADTISRAVRHACQATAAGRPGFLTSADLEVASLADRLLGAGRTMARKDFGTQAIGRLTALRMAQDAAQLATRFRAAVERYFPMRQAERLKALFAAPGRLDDLPVNELVAALVTNGNHRASPTGSC
jgi:2-methylcitrate dehydratase PrpD